MSESLKEEALRYHRFPTAGKVAISPTKTLSNQRDLSLAYSPGVAFACDAIVEDPLQADYLTARGNLVGVISNGTAVLGLGNIGALAGKPVMEGKGVLFKKFAGIDVFDIEINERDPDKLISIIASLEPTFGGINLEDIKAPECFYIESKLKEQMNIPVFHDDQHGTAIIAGAALINALRIQKKNIVDIKVTASGAGAAGIACLDLFVALGVKKENIIVCDSKGAINKQRQDKLDGRKCEFISDTNAQDLAQAIQGADVFLGVSQAGVLKAEMVLSMAENPLILALANPTPEIMPDEVHAIRSDAIVATGRSDFPNQVNNVLCFPYLFRGALDVGATTINEDMKMAAVYALADLARMPVTEEVAKAYDGKQPTFGSDYVIPKPFDPRLIVTLAPAVAEAAMKSNVATRPIGDMLDYRNRLSTLLTQSGFAMKPIMDKAKQHQMKVAFAEGEETRVLRAVVACLQEKLCKPLLIGRRNVIENRIRELQLPIIIDENVQVIEPLNNPYYEECLQGYHELRAREGVGPNEARIHMNTRSTVLAAMLVKLGYVDTMICGTIGRYHRHLRRVCGIFGTRNNLKMPAAMNMVITPKGTVFLADTHVNENPNAAEIAEIAILAADTVQRLGIKPKLALLSYSNFGSMFAAPSSVKMREALEIIHKMRPDLIVEGEMQADAALAEEVRRTSFPGNILQGTANILIMPNLDAANIGYNLMKVSSNGAAVGPILLGMKRPVQILSSTATTRRIVNVVAIAVLETEAYYQRIKKQIQSGEVEL